LRFGREKSTPYVIKHGPLVCSTHLWAGVSVLKYLAVPDIRMN